MQIKYSKQRSMMLEELKRRNDHPTADDLYLSLREKLPNISLGTVYRNLSLLAQTGHVKRILSKGPDRFDADLSDHYHLLCTECGSVTDIFLPQDDAICQKAQAAADGAQIHNYTLFFSGICPRCSGKTH